MLSTLLLTILFILITKSVGKTMEHGYIILENHCIGNGMILLIDFSKRYFFTHTCTMGILRCTFKMVISKLLYIAATVKLTVYTC